MKGYGLHTHRFKENPEEKRFADAWAKQNDGSRGTLAYLLTPPDQDQRHPLTPQPEHQIVAATVVQWLGSPVGQSFLGSLGYTRK
jgi:hypothetical protein